MCDMEPSFPHTAIPTWSGFVYQGKVAICHVLKLIEENDDISNYCLQLDSLDDFAILRNSVVNSIHQVKALKAVNYSSYEDAFIELVRKTNSYNCSQSFFHIANQIIDKTLAEIETIHHPLKIYPYNSSSYCHVDAIDGMIEQKIKDLMIKIHQDNPSKCSLDYVYKVRIYLDQIVLKQILKIHKIIHENLMSDRKASFTQTIPFSEFHEILLDDLNQRKLGDEYYFYVLLNDLHAYYQEYCMDKCNELTEDDLKKLSNYMLIIENLTKDNIVKFICNIMPHRKVSFATLRDYKDNTFNAREIKRAFLEILHKLKKSNFNSKNFFEWISGNKSYVPTTINDGGSQSEDICLDIVKNGLNTDIEILFESDFFITTDINIASIVANVPNAIRNNAEDNDRINNWKKVSLISLDNAKVEIND
jgi:hypothetical protein